MIEVKTYVVDGTEYQIGHLFARDAIGVAMRLAQLGGHTFGSLVGVVVQDSETMLAVLVRGFADAYMASDIENLALKMLSTVTTKGTDGKPLHLGDRPTFDAYFAGRIGHLIGVLRAAMVHNFADFSGALTSELVAFVVKAKGAQSATATTTEPEPETA